MKRAGTKRESAQWVADRLRRAGHTALFAGGCVRDMLLRDELGIHRPEADYDIATDATPPRVTELFRRTVQVGAQFGVVIVLVGRFRVEVATFRTESGYKDARHPDEVRFSDVRSDALRRDFTINGMFMDPFTGEVLDYVGGRNDLRARLVRAIGQPDDRLAEDHLRMLRAVRFACVLNFELEGRTEDAIRGRADLIRTVSAERIWQEWAKVLGSPNRRYGIELASRTGLLAALWPKLAGQAADIAARIGRLDADADATVGLAVQFADLPPVEVNRYCRELSLDNDTRLSAVWLVEHAADLAGEILDVVRLKKLMANANWSRLVAMSWALATETAALSANLAAAGAIPPERVAPPPLIDGADLLAMGVAEGPLIGSVLRQVYDEQLAESVTARERALERARELVQEGIHHGGTEDAGKKRHEDTGTR